MTANNIFKNTVIIANSVALLVLVAFMVGAIYSNYFSSDLNNQIIKLNMQNHEISVINKNAFATLSGLKG